MYNPSLEILEVNYSVSPGGVDEFEVYSLDERDHSSPPIYSTTSLHEAVQYCYDLGRDFTVRTFAEWEAREMMNA
jgi:hypothetical protein